MNLLLNPKHTIMGSETTLPHTTGTLGDRAVAATGVTGAPILTFIEMIREITTVAFRDILLRFLLGLSVA